MSDHHHEYMHGCGCCSMSRRCFLAMAGTSAVAATVGISGTAMAAGDLNEYIDIAGFRPKPLVKVKSVALQEPGPYWLGWPGTSYDLEGHRKEYAKIFADCGKQAGVEIEELESPILDAAAAEAFAKSIKDEKPDAVILNIQHMASWTKADIIARSGIPTIIFSAVGNCFTGHVLEISRRKGVHVISSLDATAMTQALRMVRAMRQFQNSRLLVVAGEDRKESVMDRLGVKVRYVPRAMMQDMFARMPENDEVRQIAQDMAKGAQDVVEPNQQDLLNAARVFTAAKRLMKDEEANAITTDCLGMVTQKTVPTPPCMAASMFQDAGVTYGCEADINGALSLMLTSYLFDKPGYMNDPVPETVHNTLIAAHCVSGAKLNGFDQPKEPYLLRSHSESALGVSVQVLFKEANPVTLASFQGPDKLVVDTGTVVGNVQTPPAGGCRTSVEIKMDRVEDARDVIGFHQVVFYGNHRRDLEAFCGMWGIEYVNSPQYSAKPQKA